MQSNIVSAVFDSHSEAERAIAELRQAGIDNNAISVIGKHDGDVSQTSGSGEKLDDEGKEPASFIARAAAGSGVGALLGVAALAIPAVGLVVLAGGDGGGTERDEEQRAHPPAARCRLCRDWRFEIRNAQGDVTSWRS